MGADGRSGDPREEGLEPRAGGSTTPAGAIAAGLAVVDYAVHYGLSRSLRAQGKTAEAAAVKARFQKAWARADVTLSASRF